MNLMGKPPLGLRAGKAEPDPDYIDAVRALPFCICEAFGLPQQSPTQAHHTICGRRSTVRTPDREAIPLCEGHHQGMLDTTKIAIHAARAKWVSAYGSDRDWIAVTQDKILIT